MIGDSQTWLHVVLINLSVFHFNDMAQLVRVTYLSVVLSLSGCGVCEGSIEVFMGEISWLWCSHISLVVVLIRGGTLLVICSQLVRYGWNLFMALGNDSRFSRIGHISYWAISFPFLYFKINWLTTLISSCCLGNMAIIVLMLMVFNIQSYCTFTTFELPQTLHWCPYVVSNPYSPILLDNLKFAIKGQVFVLILSIPLCFSIYIINDQLAFVLLPLT